MNTTNLNFDKLYEKITNEYLDMKNTKEIITNAYSKKRLHISVVLIEFICLIFISIFFKILHSSLAAVFTFIMGGIVFFIIDILIFAVYPIIMNKKTMYMIYLDHYKENVVAPFIKNYYGTLEYKQTAGISEYEFKKGEFSCGPDNYTTNDLIIGCTPYGQSIRIAQISTTTTSTGNGDSGSSFYALFSESERIQSISEVFKIRPHHSLIHSILSQDKVQDKVYIHNKDFNLNFNLYSTNISYAEDLFSEKLISAIVYIYKKTSFEFELTIKENKTYIQINNSSLYIDMLKKDGEKNNLIKFCKYIDFILELNTLILDAFK